MICLIKLITVHTRCVEVFGTVDFNSSYPKFDTSEFTPMKVYYTIYASNSIMNVCVYAQEQIHEDFNASF